jgi:hypothetical protein
MIKYSSLVGISYWDTEHWSSLAGSNVLLCWHRLRGLVSKGWAPRTKGSHLIYPWKQVIESKSKAQPTYGCIWLHWLFHSVSVMWPSLYFNSSSFIFLLCHPLPLLIIRTQPVCFSSGPPPCYIIPPPLTLRSTWGQRTSSWSRGLYYHSIITCAAIFLSTLASI